MLTVEADPDLGVVVFVGNLPDIKRFRGRIRQQAEEEDDGVGWGKTVRMDLPGKVKNMRHTQTVTSKFCSDSAASPHSCTAANARVSHPQAEVISKRFPFG